MTIKGHIVNGVVVLDPPASLPDGTVVTVEPFVQPHHLGERSLGQLIGLFPKEDLQEIAEMLKDCRQIDPDGW